MAINYFYCSTIGYYSQIPPLSHTRLERRSKILLADYFLTGSKYFAHNVGLA